MRSNLKDHNLIKEHIQNPFSLFICVKQLDVLLCPSMTWDRCRIKNRCCVRPSKLVTFNVKEQCRENLCCCRSAISYWRPSLRHRSDMNRRTKVRFSLTSYELFECRITGLSNLTNVCGTQLHWPANFWIYCVWYLKIYLIWYRLTHFALKCKMFKQQFFFVILTFLSPVEQVTRFNSLIFMFILCLFLISITESVSTLNVTSIVREL
jgi:hypothetical protein